MYYPSGLIPIPLPKRDEHIWNWDHGTVISNSVAYSVDNSGHEDAGEGGGKAEDVGAGGSKVEIKTFDNIYSALRYYRTLKTVPMGQEYITMRTGTCARFRVLNV